jgi:hypothetical protein
VTLQANGEYLQEVVVKGAPGALRRQGRWRYDPKQRYVEMERALAVANPLGGLKADYQVPFDGLVLLKVRSSRPVRLATAYEDLDFVKQ